MPTLLHSASWQLSTSCCVKVVFEAQRSLLAVFFQNVLMMGAKIILFLRTHKLFTIILRTHSSDIDFPHICLPTLCTCPSVLVGQTCFQYNDSAILYISFCTKPLTLFFPNHPNKVGQAHDVVMEFWQKQRLIVFGHYQCEVFVFHFL